MRNYKSKIPIAYTQIHLEYSKNAFIYQIERQTEAFVFFSVLEIFIKTQFENLDFAHYIKTYPTTTEKPSADALNEMKYKLT